MLEVQEVRYQYPEAVITASFTVTEGASLALMGPSGCGKSTVLNLVSGFLVPQSGDIRFGGDSLVGLEPAERPLTHLFQAHNLFPHLKVWQNIGLGIHPGLKLSTGERARVAEVLSEVGLPGFDDRIPDQLSGGQQQRVALARCLLRNRPLLLLDEPFSALDAGLRQEMIELLLTFQAAQSLTLLFTTHQTQDATALGAAVHRMGSEPQL